VRAANRHTETLFPSLDRANSATKILRDLFPCA
jgi:hypothetical protein